MGARMYMMSPLATRYPGDTMPAHRSTVLAAALAAAVLPVALAGPATAAPGATVIKVQLSGSEEVPPVEGGTGRVGFVLHPDRDRICYQLDDRDVVGETTMFHIHEAAEGTNGPVVVPFFLEADDARRAGCVEVDGDLVQDIIDNPEDYYANVHSDTFPAGAIRGQLG